MLVPEVLDPAACAAEPPAKRAKPDDACAEPHAEQECKGSTACAPGGEQGRGERRGGAKRVRELFQKARENVGISGTVEK